MGDSDAFRALRKTIEEAMKGSRPRNSHDDINKGTDHNNENDESNDTHESRLIDHDHAPSTAYQDHLNTPHRNIQNLLDNSPTPSTDHTSPPSASFIAGADTSTDLIDLAAPAFSFITHTAADNSPSSSFSFFDLSAYNPFASSSSRLLSPRSRTPSPLQSRSPSPGKFRTPNTLQSRSPSPQESRTPSALPSPTLRSPSPLRTSFTPESNNGEESEDSNTVIYPVPPPDPPSTPPLPASFANKVAKLKFQQEMQQHDKELDVYFYEVSKHAIRKRTFKIGAKEVWPSGVGKDSRNMKAKVNETGKERKRRKTREWRRKKERVEWRNLVGVLKGVEEREDLAKEKLGF